VEVKELSNIIRLELKKLAERMEALKTLQQGRDPDYGSANKTTSDHRSGVVKQLNEQISDIGSKFTQALQASQSSMKAQRERREQLAATAASIPSSSMGPSQRAVHRPRSGLASPDVRQEGSHTAIEMPFQKMALIDSQQGETTSLMERNSALQSIESTINEVASLYQQLAHLITQQGEDVQRIDMNIGDMQINVQRGHQQLIRYLRSVSSNRALMIKIFAIFICFVVMYMFFLA